MASITYIYENVKFEPNKNGSEEPCVIFRAYSEAMYRLANMPYEVHTLLRLILAYRELPSEFLSEARSLL